MSKLEVLGTSNLKRHDDVDVQSVLQQPRRFALLVYLALAARKGPVNRDAVVGVFWPDSEPGRARGALSQALHYLRRSLGRNVIENVDQELLTVNRSVVTCDAVEFLDAVDAGRWRQAAELYAGDLLPGFFESSETVEFEHWLYNERRRLRQGASKCAWNLAVQAADAGETADAIVWARRTCEWSPNDEAEVRRLMAFMDRLGDRTGVIDAYERLVQALAPLDAAPSAETKALLDAVRDGWAREKDAIQEDASSGPADPPVRPAGAFGVPQVHSGSEPDPTPPRRSVGRLRSSGLILLFAGAIIVLWGLRRPGGTNRHENPTVLVEELHSEATAPVAASAMSDQIVTYLQSNTNLDVVAGTDHGPLLHGRPVDFIVRGGIVRQGNRLQANIHLVDGSSGETVASKQFERTQPDSLATLDELSATITDFVRRSIGGVLEDRRIANARVPQKAIALVELGRRDRHMADSLDNANTWQAAEATFVQADSTFNEASAIAPKWGRPWLERATNAYHRTVHYLGVGSDDRGTAFEAGRNGMAYADKALQRNVDDVQALETRALLAHMLSSLVPSDSVEAVTRLLDQAEKDARRVTTIDPHRARAWAVLGRVFLTEGAWNEAYWALKRAVAEDTYMRNNLQIILNLATAAWEIDDIAADRAWCAMAKRRVGVAWPSAFCEMNIEAVVATPDTSIIGPLRARLATQPDWQQVRNSFDALAAVLYARSRAPNKARALLQRTRATPDPTADNPLPYEAWAWLELGKKQMARTILQRYVDGSPATRRAILRSRRFSGLNPAPQTP